MQHPSPTTYTQANEETLYILFADLKEYSSNKDNLDLIGQMEDALYDIGAEYFDQTKGHCFKVLGDGIVATDTDVHAIAHKALNSATYIQEKFADAEAFKNKPQIRIALHVAQPGEVRARYMNFPLENVDINLSLFKDIAGGPVINAARIEPVVKPDFVFCSKIFVEHLGKQADLKTDVLGTYELGKKHDKFEVELSVLYAADQTVDLEDLRNHIDSKQNNKQTSQENTSSISQHYQTFMGQEVNTKSSFFEKLKEKSSSKEPPKFLKKILPKPPFVKADS